MDIELNSEYFVVDAIVEQPSPEVEKIMNDANILLEKITLEQEAKELAKQSALAKLAKLGLTEEEAKAVIGL